MEIGAVSSIALNVQKDRLNFAVPVIIEIDPDRMVYEGEKDADLHASTQRLIDNGLRAQLEMQSLVTGQMMIELKFMPDTPVRLKGLSPEYPEIPTVPSSMEQLAQRMEELPIEKITQELLDVIKHIDDVIIGEEVQDILRNVAKATGRVDDFIVEATRLVKDADERLVIISEKLGMTMDDTRSLVNNANGQIQPLSDKVQASLLTLKASLDQARATLENVDGFIGPDSDTRYKLNKSLDAIGAAARSLKSLGDYLERHPESLLRGKGGPS